MSPFDAMVSQIVKPNPPHAKTEGEEEVKKTVAAGSEQDRVQKVNNTPATKSIKTRKELEECVQDCIMQYDNEEARKAGVCKELYDIMDSYVQGLTLKFQQDFEDDWGAMKQRYQDTFAEYLRVTMANMNLAPGACKFELDFQCQDAINCPPVLTIEPENRDATYLSFDGRLTEVSRTVNGPCTEFSPLLPNVTTGDREDTRRVVFRGSENTGRALRGGYGYGPTGPRTYSTKRVRYSPYD